MDSYDVLIIGGGQGGIPLATALHKAGKRVALAEKAQLGGSCVNWGCTPTKAFVTSAKHAHEARRAEEYGLKLGEVSVDFPAVMARARRIAADSREGIQESFEEEDAPDLLRGHARFVAKTDDGFELETNDTRVSANQVVLNTGSSARIPELEGLESVEYLDAKTWLDNDELPEHLMILGGGYIGLEMGQAYRRLGANITIVETGEQLAAKEDKDIAEAIQGVLEDEGIEVHLKAELESVEKTSEGVKLNLSGGKSLGASKLFVAVGRVPNTSELGLDKVGVELDDKGYTKVDESLKTNVEGIWAMGDIRGGPMFTHTSYDDFRVVESAMLGDGSHTTKRVVPYGMFTDPQLGRVGQTEGDAKDEGYSVKVASYDMSKSGKANETGQTRGKIKVVVDEKTDKLLGAAVFAAEGAELVHTYIALMNADVPYKAYENGIPVHPTYNEALHSVLKDLS